MNFIEKTLLFLVTFLLLTSCNPKQKAGDKEVLFKFPIVYNSDYKSHSELSIDSVKYISEVFPLVIGKYRFTDSVDIGVRHDDTTFMSDYFFEKFSKYEIIDSLDVNGLELMTDYETTIRLQDRYVDDS